ncbi:hypothetical protein EYF80_042247 [Liparis tanakae]|uniref:Uncharacterized protein n=1 Tax=Liparis tanakae TaxID=230148 RepID=A0A4Z2G1U3_9TELE|nr:hypothetical protein EYF80_042247 [Liparis tanakae]
MFRRNTETQAEGREKCRATLLCCSWVSTVKRNSLGRRSTDFLEVTSQSDSCVYKHPIRMF